MRLSKIVALLPSALLCLALLLPATPAEAKPKGRKWSSLGVVGMAGDCYEMWTRNHWLYGWQTVYEPVPCPERIAPPGGIGVVFSDHSAFIPLSDDLKTVPWVFGEPVNFVLQSSEVSMGPVMNYGQKASLVELSADGEDLVSTYQEPVEYVDSVLVQESFGLSDIFTGPHQAALVALPGEGRPYLTVYSVITVEPITE
jgi:hypothetical protein